MAKIYFKRYIWLIRRLQMKRMTIKEIRKAWKECSFNDYDTGFPARTLHSAREAIRDIFGIEIQCDRSTNEYYIADDSPMYGDGLRRWMLEAMSLNNLLNESAGDRNLVQFEDVPSAKGWLEEILKAIKAGKKIKCVYQGYSMPVAREMTVHPYGLKQYQRLWYLVGRNEFNGDIRQFALDGRMQALSVSDEDYTFSADFSLEEFYRYRMGVLDGKEENACEVMLKVHSRRVRQLRNLPLHKSQRELEVTDSYSVFQYDVYANTDFINAIMPFAQDVEILEPKFLRDSMRRRISDISRIYQEK